MAFVATVYGVGSANLLFLPIANKMKIKHKDHLVTKRMYVEGIASIQAGDHPNIVEQKLGSLLVNAKKAKSGPDSKAE